MDTNLIAYLISLAASMSWDGLKRILTNKADSNPERQAMLAVASTMEAFYQYMGFEYDEDLVMDSFICSARQYQDFKWHLRDVIEFSIAQPISDEQFEWWVTEYTKKIPWGEQTFVERNQTLSRIKYKLIVRNVPSCGDLDAIIEPMIKGFQTSWKQEVINLLNPLDLDLSFAKKAENCDVILAFFEQLEIDWDQVEDERILREYLDHPHYNIVQLVSGTSGSGKTHFIEEYTRESLKRFGTLPIPCSVNAESLQTLHTDIINSLKSFLEVECESLKEYSLLLDALSIKIAIVIENVNVLLNDDWVKVASIIEDFARFDTFKFIITINEYEYYQLESNPQFLRRYCIGSRREAFLKHCLSMDAFNKDQDVVGEILKTEFEVDSHFKAGLTTPQEAIYYGQCVREEKELAPPSSYYEYIEKITRWKERQVNSGKLGQILEAIIKQKSSVVMTELDVSSFRHAQLLTPEKQKSIFATTRTYHLRIYPYWAAKIVGFDTDGLLEYSEELKEWLVSCYIFYRYRDVTGIDNLQVFFEDLREKGLLEYAVFCAHKADIGFMRELNDFLLNIDIDNPRLCYAVLRFISQCPLKIVEKFALCTHLANKIEEYGLTELYSGMLDYILATTSKADNLRKNMLALVPCTVDTISHINGYKVGNKYMALVKDGTIHELAWIVVQFIIQNGLEKQIETGNNKSFMDYFLRKCFEHYIGHHKKSLRSVYDELKGIFKMASPVGPFVKRNLTCAAGNLFENRKDEAYQNEYIKLAQHFAEADDLSDRLTAWFLIRNSVEELKDELDTELIELLKDLMSDTEIMSKKGLEIEEFAKGRV